MKVNTKFIKEVKEYGAFDISACFNCGNCTAVCPLSKEDSSFPRKMIRYAQLGDKKAIEASLEPWMCYYCGECSATCPRQAYPGEFMMSLRRWLITEYDWTGIAGKFYKSWLWELTGIIAVAGFVFVLWGYLFGLPTSAGGKTFNELAPANVIHILDAIMGTILSFFLLSFIFNMYLKVLRKDKTLEIPFKLYFTEAYHLVFNFATQWRFSECEKEPENFFKRLRSGQYNYWAMHLILMSSYVAMFIMIAGFLVWFQGDDASYSAGNIQRILGFLATAGLVAGTAYFAAKRIKKDDEKGKFSHHTDWGFIILLFLTTVTGLAIFFCRISGSPLLAFYVYLIHTMVAVPMLVIEVPFSKWSHLAYRPFAIYFENIRKKAMKLRQEKTV